MSQTHDDSIFNVHLEFGYRYNNVEYGFSADSNAKTGVTSYQIVLAAQGQTITFANPGTQIMGTTPSLIATSDSNLTVSLTSSTPNVCTIANSGQLTLVAPGACTITASQLGNYIYPAATSVSQTFEVKTNTPETWFELNSNEIRQVLVDEAKRSLVSTLSVNQRAIRDARTRLIDTRDRFITSQRERVACAQNKNTEGTLEVDCGSEIVSRNDIPFDIDGSFDLNGATLNTRGNFFEQSGNNEGTQRRLFFGEFDIQHDANTDSSTATLSARVAWEQMYGDTTMLGNFVGGELATSNISGVFEGDHQRVAVTAGSYFVQQLADDLFIDGFLAYGIGHNNLEMANDALALTSDYTTRTATAGAALSGVYEYDRYEFRPELAFSYGKTWIGNVSFTGRAYGLVDDALRLDAGTVSIANLTLRPEVIWALDADTVSESRSQLSFAPRAICERSLATTRTENCGAGAELGLSSVSDDGLSTADFHIIYDRVDSSNRSSFAFNLEHRF